MLHLVSFWKSSQADEGVARSSPRYREASTEPKKHHQRKTYSQWSSRCLWMSTDCYLAYGSINQLPAVALKTTISIIRVRKAQLIRTTAVSKWWVWISMKMEKLKRYFPFKRNFLSHLAVWLRNHVPVWLGRDWRVRARGKSYSISHST